MPSCILVPATHTHRKHMLSTPRVNLGDLNKELIIPFKWQQEGGWLTHTRAQSQIRKHGVKNDQTAAVMRSKLPVQTEIAGPRGWRGCQSNSWAAPGSGKQGFTCNLPQLWRQSFSRSDIKCLKMINCMGEKVDLEEQMEEFTRIPS